MNTEFQALQNKASDGATALAQYRQLAEEYQAHGTQYAEMMAIQDAQC